MGTLYDCCQAASSGAHTTEPPPGPDKAGISLQHKIAPLDSTVMSEMEKQQRHEEMMRRIDAIYGLTEEEDEGPGVRGERSEDEAAAGEQESGPEESVGNQGPRDAETPDAEV